ncbi:MAG: 50S ribosomal protein L20 [Rubinisphaera brasiliensis]|uniref:Large ribosomal subunit protein bL20 n=1 Tax=Rubinisphaera brasiliensis (strain ATCC 49424 / DSM 5305 / JCM 21570 / IAM 15109 / NBRC 103401 / IFAM 1448) TaxID=756272 RepID=F0SQV2_RUBBR|nr:MULTISPECIES: 50S ribosomal protein L20 [Rubinisphaera]ADY60173.1 LSU ribosomal protein L20P [Rubinisphaera brasiliensis DSM 5305]MBB02902.1 50S ribosomal protein L20 [Planctomyces sp.]MBR9802566.1 50S ribosomal protein L20 [bacterium]
MRVKTSKARLKSKKRLLREARGNFGKRKNLIRTVQETILRARVYAFRDRRVRKREMRKLWITRLNAACRMHGLRYSEFIHLAGKANLGLNRKSLSELAFHEPAIFAEVIEAVKAQAAA